MTPFKRRTSPAESAGIIRARQATISELVSALEICNPEAPVRFAFGNAYPEITEGECPFSLYVDSPDTVAIGFATRGAPPTVKAMLEVIEPWVNGYIPAEFTLLRIDANMPIWVSNGDATNTALIGVHENPLTDEVYLQTWAIT